MCPKIYFEIECISKNQKVRIFKALLQVSNLMLLEMRIVFSILVEKRGLLTVNMTFPDVTYITLVNVYVNLLVIMRIAGTS